MVVVSQYHYHSTSRSSYVWMAIIGFLMPVVFLLPQQSECFQLRQLQQPVVTTSIIHDRGGRRRSGVTTTGPQRSTEGGSSSSFGSILSGDTSHSTTRRTLVRLFDAQKLWDRMEIEEDIEPHWYLINCIAGLEMDLLGQCREVCRDMPDAIKFVVPTETKTRSHGANRMVTETKTKYLGYVFAKLRLCPEVYGAIQSLDLCRSWMGTINRKGYKKLPPHPVALNDLEVENFGLEDMEFEEVEEEFVAKGDKNVELILDEPGADDKNQVDQEAIKAFLGLKVEDMVKVTKPCKFYDEDGVVRRLKDGRILVRFYTYGSLFEEWMDPSDVRKLNDVEVLKGLSGPTTPITQRDIDGPQEDGFGSPTKGRHAARSFGGDLIGNVKGARGPRNRRQDRVGRGQTDRNFGNTGGDDERKNWEWYKENRRGDDGAFADDEWSYRPQSNSNNDALGDDDAQWGRRPPSQRQQRRDRKSTQQRRNNDDWSAFVTPASAPAEDDFFSSLMTDLSKDLNKGDGGDSGTTKSSTSEDDDFFASLISTTEDKKEKKPQASKNEEETASSLSVDDFFASLDYDVEQQSKKDQSKKKDSLFDEDDLFDSFDVVDSKDEETDDFFKSLDSVLKSTTTTENENAPDDFFGSFAEKPPEEGKSSKTGDDDDDFFASLERELGSTLETEKTVTECVDAHDHDDGDDFFAALGETLSSEIDESSGGAALHSEKDSIPHHKIDTGAVPTHSETASDLTKLTVPKLKEMLKARGLKVSGKKAELIERLRD